MTNGGSGPTITLGLPVYNGELYVAEAIEAVLDQDLTDFRMVISDNASTDRTPEIIERYAEKEDRISVITQPRNLGSAANWSGLVEHATSPYFKWVAADDLIAPTFLSRCIEVLDRHPEAVLAYPQTIVIDDRGEPLFHHDESLHTLDADPAVRLREFAMHRGYNMAIHGVFRTWVLRDIPPMQGKVSADITMMAEVLLRGGFYEVPERLFYRRKVVTSVGLGALNRRQKQALFDPSARAYVIPPDVRVAFDIQRAIASCDLPLRDRVRTGWSYAAAGTKRRARGLAGRVGSRLTAWSQTSEPSGTP